jgi:hypothetical protein
VFFHLVKSKFHIPKTNGSYPQIISRIVKTQEGISCYHYQHRFQSIDALLPKNFFFACVAILSRRNKREGASPRAKAKAGSLLPLTFFFIFLFLPYLLHLTPCTFIASAASVTIAWDRNAETDVIGYKLHYGILSQNYQHTVDLENNTNCSISGLAEGTTYYFAVTAYNDKDLESGYSEELAHTIPITPPPGQEGLEAHFDSDDDGFSYAPDTFNNTAKPNYSTGNYAQNGGFTGDGLRVFLGPGSTGGATSGGWSKIFSVDQDGIAQVTVSFRLRMDQGYETNEFGEVILEIDGIRHGNDVNNSLVHVTGNGNGGGIDDTGWLTESFNVPLNAGDDHELMIGAYNNNATYSDESVEVFIDDITVVIIPDTPPPPADTFTIAASAGGCGTISPPGTTTVDHGADQTYTMLPQDNCIIANVIVDGQSIGTPSTYTFANVTSSHTIVADFAENEEVLSVEVRVASGSDDAEESDSGSIDDLSSSDLELVYDGYIDSDQTVSIRFSGVAIPQNANIVNAYVQFQVDENSSVSTSLTIEGEAIDDAPTFTSSSGNISSRVRTSANVAWCPVPWTKLGEASLDQRTPDISQVIQEIVDRPGWSSLNSLVVIITGTGKRVAESYNGDQSGAPLLHVDYK